MNTKPLYFASFLFPLFVGNCFPQIEALSLPGEVYMLDSDNSVYKNEFLIQVGRAHASITLENLLSPTNSTHLYFDPISRIYKSVSVAQHNQHQIESISQCFNKTGNKLLMQESIQSKAHNFNYYSKQILCECLSTLPESLGAQGCINDNIRLEIAPSETPHPVPVFHCNQYERNSGQIKTCFRMEYPGGPDLRRNLTSEMIPKSFLVQVRTATGGKWEFVGPDGLEENWLFSVNTKMDETFQIRVTAISSRYVYIPVITPNIVVYDPALLPRNNSMDVQLVDISVEKENMRGASALLRWKSSTNEDTYQASCDYDVFYMDEDKIRKARRRTGDTAFWVKLMSLEYNQNYNVRIIEKFGEEGGQKFENISPNFHIQIPSCLQLHNYSFEFCPPPPPTNIRLLNMTNESFGIKWKSPQYSDDEFNRIISYNISVEWMYTSMFQQPIPADNTLIIFSSTVPGNTTSVLIQNVSEMRGHFKVKVTALGSAGPSKSAWNILAFQARPTEQIGAKTWTVTADRQIFILVIFGLLGSFLSLVLLHMGVIYILKMLHHGSRNLNISITEKPLDKIINQTLRHQNQYIIKPNNNNSKIIINNPKV